jgi:hypothetical protein
MVKDDRTLNSWEVELALVGEALTIEAEHSSIIGYRCPKDMLKPADPHPELGARIWIFLAHPPRC